ncbi:MAG: phage tail protein [Marinirhabdus sp.]
MEPFIGQIQAFGFNFAPRGWAKCEGQLLSINENTALFSLLGTIYGGDGRTTFGLPDLRGRMPIGEGQGPGLTNRQLGTMGGSENNTLTTSQLPNIPVNVSSANATESAPTSGATLAAPNTPSGRTSTPVNGYNTATPDVTLNPATAGGNGTAVNNMPPFIALNWCIALQGVYPSRN